MFTFFRLIIFITIYIILSSYSLIASDQLNIDSMLISKKAKDLLKKEQKHWCNPINEGINTFSFDSNPVTSIVLGMDGEVAEIIEYNKFSCKVGYGRSGGGSGGYPVALIIENVIYDLELVRGGWEVINFNKNWPVLLLSRHGSFCNLSGTYACLQSFVYHNKVLSTPSDWLCIVKDEVSCGKNPMNGVEILKLN